MFGAWSIMVLYSVLKVLSVHRSQVDGCADARSVKNTWNVNIDTTDAKLSPQIEIGISHVLSKKSEVA